MVNEFKTMGYDIMCFHTDMRVHDDESENLQYRWGLSCATRLKILPLAPVED